MSNLDDMFIGGGLQAVPSQLLPAKYASLAGVDSSAPSILVISFVLLALYYILKA